MRDIDIRGELWRSLKIEYFHDPTTRIINELGLCRGTCRIDVALVNGALHGFEIKSEADTLERLPGQADMYNKILDTVTLICHQKHIDGVKRVVPEWWGLMTAVEGPAGTSLTPLRKGGVNPTVVPEALVELLWRDETLKVLETMGLAKGLKSQPRRVLWARLAATLPLDDLRALVRQRLKVREGWPTPVSPIPDGDSFQPSATARDSQTGRPSRIAGRTGRPS